ncbi:MAG: hypothetical protein RR428_08015 [Coprobacillus sp.]
MKKNLFRISVIGLVIVLIVVSFYMFYVHVPYYQHHDNLAKIRNEICEKNNYEYMDYFTEYRSNELYYIVKIKVNDMPAYVAYNEEKVFVNSFQGTVASEENVKKDMEGKYKVSIDKLDIGYENNKFVYYAHVQDDESLYYLYYDLASGEFVKAYKL